MQASQDDDGGICPKCGTAYLPRYLFTPSLQRGDRVKITGGKYADLTGFVTTIDEKMATVNLDDPTFNDGIEHVDVVIDYLQNMTHETEWVTIEPV